MRCGDIAAPTTTVHVSHPHPSFLKRPRAEKPEESSGGKRRDAGPTNQKPARNGRGRGRGGGEQEGKKTRKMRKMKRKKKEKRGRRRRRGATGWRRKKIARADGAKIVPLFAF